MKDTQCVVGGGAGFAGDRIDAAVELVRGAPLDALILECLAERTVALAQQRMRAGLEGFDPLLKQRFAALFAVSELPRILSNLGAADPRGAQKALAGLAAIHGRTPTIAAVTGDDVLELVKNGAVDDPFILELLEAGAVISANAYIGAEPLLDALHAGADIVIGGRIADPSLVVAPVAWKLGLELTDIQRIANATVAGHLIECGAQATGGYFADPGIKDVPDLARVGFPLAQITEDEITIAKAPDTGGIVDHRTVREQLLYEISNPESYPTPDVTVAFDSVTVTEITDGVRVSGVHGFARPESLKVSVGYNAGFRVEAAISYQGSGAARRARQAAAIVRERTGLSAISLHAEMLDGFTDGHEHSRLYLTAVDHDRKMMERVAMEVEALGTNGPAGGGGWRAGVQPALGIAPAYIPRTAVQTAVHMQKVV